MQNNVLVLGGGGREHALCCALQKSDKVVSLYAAPGSDAIASHATCLAVAGDQSSYVSHICDMVEQYSIDLVVVGPEQPLTLGVTDALRAKGVAVFGPSQKASVLESSKAFMKDICHRYGIPTANYQVFKDVDEALCYIDVCDFPIVIKADGLAAGKGVVIAQTKQEAEDTLKSMMVDCIFGDSGKTIVIEDFLEGVELSYFALCDGERVVPFGSAQDHKSLHEGGKGPNTGGMGAYSPVAFCDQAMEDDIQARILHPLVEAMRKEGCPYQGVLFLGIMVTKHGVQLLECNVRFGDPECQVLTSLLSHDFFDVLMSCAKGELDRVPSQVLSARAALTVVVAAKGYPFDYEKNVSIPDLTTNDADMMIFHAGTKKQDDGYYSTGGRVLNVTVVADDIDVARQKAYAFLEEKGFKEHFYYRQDIGLQQGGLS